MLVDTDVIIWYMRGDGLASEKLDRLSPFHISVVTYMELVQGMRTKREFESLRLGLKAWRTKILFLDEIISAKAMMLVEQYFHSHSLRVADSLIGATAITHNFTLLTGNTKHYRAVKELSLKEFVADVKKTGGKSRAGRRKK
jgi:predicted nucleic acid-binding protein